MNPNEQWWLNPGTEVCPFCEARLHFEVAHYCTLCDQLICQLCTFKDLMTRNVFCPTCVSEREAF